MLTPAQKAGRRRTLHAFERAVREHEFKGARHPNDHDAIQANYFRALKTMEKLLGIAVAPKPKPKAKAKKA